MSVTVPVDLRESTRLIGTVVNDLALDDLHAQRRRQDENQTVGCIKNLRPAGVVGECDQFASMTASALTSSRVLAISIQLALTILPLRL